MTNIKKRFTSLLIAAATLLSCFTLAACDGGWERYSEHSFEYFDTVTTVTGYAETKAEFDKVAADILSGLEEYHRLCNIYEEYDGVANLYTVNQLDGGKHPIVKVDRKIIDMLLYAKETYALTNGKVNIALGSVLSIWHTCREEAKKDPASARLPSTEELAAASEHTEIECLVIDESACAVTLTDPQMTLDVGAIAKGYAVEMVAREMEKKQISGYLINVGGNVRAIGEKPDGSRWVVGVESPEGKEEHSDRLALTGEALVTSGSYQRYYTVNGERYHHIIDPDTLMPAKGFLSVSVLTADSALGDALSTALFCMTLSEGEALIGSLPHTEAMWILPNGEKRVTDGWSVHREE